ncbi:FmdB family zinc ribbon protein [Fimbriiglobus ruber]|uniref:FmdB family zinc ribbon protein n=1 Tax=Fimbriiglobus ruber TaxID=1908690 RepID=UPI00117B8CD2
MISVFFLNLSCTETPSVPIYPFTCNACGTAFESLVARPTTSPRAECPECQSENVTRGFGVPAKTTAQTSAPLPRTNCRGDGPPCGAAWCGRGPAAD